jgi:hypothetical protein
MDQKEVLRLCRALVALNEKPEPGLSTWNEACAETVEELRAALAVPPATPERAALEILRSLGQQLGRPQDEDDASYVARIHAALIPLLDGRSVPRRFLARIERLGAAHGLHGENAELVPDYIERVLAIVEDRAAAPDLRQALKAISERARDLELAARNLDVLFGPLPPLPDGHTFANCPKCGGGLCHAVRIGKAKAAP